VRFPSFIICLLVFLFFLIKTKFGEISNVLLWITQLAFSFYGLINKFARLSLNRPLRWFPARIRQKIILDFYVLPLGVFVYSFALFALAVARFRLLNLLFLFPNFFDCLFLLLFLERQVVENIRNFGNFHIVFSLLAE